MIGNHRGHREWLWPAMVGGLRDGVHRERARLFLALKLLIASSTSTVGASKAIVGVALWLVFLHFAPCLALCALPCTLVRCSLLSYAFVIAALGLGCFLRCLFAVCCLTAVPLSCDSICLVTAPRRKQKVKPNASTLVPADTCL